MKGHDNINERFKKNILKNFGPGSIYWKNLGLRSKYKKVKDWRGIINGPWIHQNVIETVKNIKLKKNLRVGLKLMSQMVFVQAFHIFFMVLILKV